MAQENYKYTVTIIGLGKIGLLYDLNKSFDSNEFLTHVRSAFFHQKFEIKYLIDSDLKKLNIAKKKYGNNIKYLKSIDNSFDVTDIIVLSSFQKVNSYHLKKLKKNKKVKLFLIEKPFLNDNDKISSYIDVIDKSYINYYRKSLPFFKELKKNIDNYHYGNLIAANIYYSKGLSNNGSHLIDLMNFLFNSSFDIDSINIISYKNDYSEDDESVSFSINYSYNSKTVTSIFHSLDERKFSLIEIDLFFDKNRFRIFDFGGKIEIYKVESDLVFSGYKNLVPQKTVDSKINSYGIFTFDSIYNILEGNQENFSTLREENLIYDIKKNIQLKLSKFKKRKK